MLVTGLSGRTDEKTELNNKLCVQDKLVLDIPTGANVLCCTVMYCVYCNLL